MKESPRIGSLTFLSVLIGLVTLMVLWASPHPLAAAPALQGEATAEACAAPTLRPTVGTVNVRQGPSEAYDIIATLTSADIVPVVGRAEFYPYWLVMLPDGSDGWVAASIARVDGYIAGLPLLPPPAIEGVVLPPSSEPWAPTPTSVCAATFTPTPQATADATATPTAVAGEADVWTGLTNLSESGAATEPAMVTDNNGVTHVIWQESEIESFMYAAFEDGSWTEIQAVELPFGTRAYYPDLQDDKPTPLFTPQLAVDSGGVIHALWIDEEGTVWHSRVAAENFATYAAWTTRQAAAASAATVAVTVGARDVLHVAYIRPLHNDEGASGVYYQQSTDGGSNWSEPALLYQSLYLRAISVEEAHLQLSLATVDDVEHLVVVWDNPPLEKVFLALSQDAGATWEAAVEIDGRAADDANEAQGPAGIVVGTHDGTIMLLWQAGHGGETCVPYYQWSDDGGVTWSGPLPLESLGICARQNYLLSRSEWPLMLLAEIGEDAYLSAWNGDVWSDPELQDTLSSFINPATNQIVSFECIVPEVTEAGALFVAGCSPTPAQDIWFLQRTLGEPAQWFPAPSVWEDPYELQAEIATVAKVDAVADSGGSLHFFWSRADGNEIYYGRWDEDGASQPSAVLSSPTGQADAPSVAMSRTEHLMVTWSDSKEGEIFFSEVPVANAAVGANWLEPHLLTENVASARAPSIAVAADNTIYVAYAVPLNEERGIYVVQSHDDGRTWSEPAVVFDGAAAGWSMLAEPELTIDEGGRLHALWARTSLASQGEPEALYYANSLDGGQTWSDPTLVVEASVIQHIVVTIGSRTVYLIWLEDDNGRLTLTYSESRDAGSSWSPAALLSGYEEDAAPIGALVDWSDRMHLLQMEGSTLHHWMRQEDAWEEGDTMALDSEITVTAAPLAVVTSVNGDLFVGFVGRYVSQETNDEQDALFVARRPLTYPAEKPTPQPTLTPTPQASPTPAPTATPSPTATAPFAPLSSTDGSGPLTGTNSLVVRLASGIIPALLLVVVIFAVGVWAVRYSRR